MSRKDDVRAPRKVWRMSANAPLGEILTVRPVSEEPRQPSVAADLGQWGAEGDWVTSSWDLLTGLEVRDYTGRVSPRVFDKLFKD